MFTRQAKYGSHQSALAPRSDLPESEPDLGDDDIFAAAWAAMRAPKVTAPVRAAKFYAPDGPHTALAREDACFGADADYEGPTRVVMSRSAAHIARNAPVNVGVQAVPEHRTVSTQADLSRERRDALSAQHCQVQQQLVRAEAKLRWVHGTVADLRAKAFALAWQATTLSRGSESRRDERSALVAELGELRQRIAEATATAETVVETTAQAAVATHREAFMPELAELRGILETVTGERDNLERQIATMSRRLEDKGQQIHAQALDRKDLELAAERSQAERATTLTANSELQQALEEAQSQLRQTRRALAEQQRPRSAVERADAAARAALGAMVDQATRAFGTAAGLAAELRAIGMQTRPVSAPNTAPDRLYRLFQGLERVTGTITHAEIRGPAEAVIRRAAGGEPPPQTEATAQQRLGTLVGLIALGEFTNLPTVRQQKRKMKILDFDHVGAPQTLQGIAATITDTWFHEHPEYPKVVVAADGDLRTFSDAILRQQKMAATILPTEGSAKLMMQLYTAYCAAKGYELQDNHRSRAPERLTLRDTRE